MNRWKRRSAPAWLLAAALLLTVVASPAAPAKEPPAANAAVIRTWNDISLATIAGPAPNGVGKANAEAFPYMAFVQAAVYNAVNGITGRYELYNWNAKAPQGASPEAAAAVAAHDVLLEYFGTGFANSTDITANLNSRLETSLDAIPDGVPKDQGIRYGQRAAERIIDLRTDDGRNAPITFNPPNPTAPGVWRPTPPAMAPFLVPWLGFMKPLMLNSIGPYDPGPPPAIGTATYNTEFAEVRDHGVNTNPNTTETTTGKFFSDIAPARQQEALRDLAQRKGLDISDSARMFAAVDLSLADALVVVWRAKYDYGWWRPITAIRESGLTTWTPLIGTPPYPEWPSGLSSVTGALSTSLTLMNGAVDLYITSTAAGLPGPPLTRHYQTAAQIQTDVINARVWGGIHFRRSDEAGVAIGTQVASFALAHYFAPTH